MMENRWERVVLFVSHAFFSFFFFHDITRTFVVCCRGFVKCTVILLYHTDVCMQPSATRVQTFFVCLGVCWVICYRSHHRKSSDTAETLSWCICIYNLLAPLPLPPPHTPNFLRRWTISRSFFNPKIVFKKPPCSSYTTCAIRTGTPLTQVRFPGAARDFSPRVNFQCRLSFGVRTPPVCNRMQLHRCARSRSCKSTSEFGGLWKH